jgi:hypothetical protein
MKRIILLSGLLLALFATSCGVLRQTGELGRFAKSRFELVGFHPINIAGVDVSQKHHFSDLNVHEIFQMGKRFFSHDMPSQVALSIHATNPFLKPASIAGLSWIMLLQQDTLASGKVNQAVHIAALAETNFPLVVEFNLVRLMRSGSLDKVINLALNGSNNADNLQKLGLSIKIKPYYRQGKLIKQYPGYITIKPDLGKAVNHLSK